MNAERSGSTPRRSRPEFVRLAAALVLGFVAMYGVLAINRSPLLPGASSDSVSYVEAARSFARTGALTVPSTEWSSPDSVGRLSNFPPGFPVLLSVPMRLGVPAYSSALMVMAVSSGVVVAMVLLLVGESFGLGAGLLAAALVMLTPAFVKLDLAIWSEPTFLALTLATLWAMVRRPRSPILYGLLAAAALSVRYVGVAGSALACIWAAVQAGSRRERAVAAAVAGAPSGLFGVLWLWYVHAGAGAGRHAAVYGGLGEIVRGIGENLRQVPGLLVDWLLPTPLQAHETLAVAVLVLGALGFVAALARGSWATPARGRFLLLAGIYAGLYCSVVLLAKLLAPYVAPLDARTFAVPFDVRIFAPVLVLAECVVAASIVSLGPRWRIPALAAAGLWCAFMVRDIHQGVTLANRVGRFYTYRAWISDPTIRWLDNQSRPYHVVYSNEPDLVYFQTGRHAKLLPHAGGDLTGFRAAFHAHPGVLFFAEPPHPRDIPPAAFAAWLHLLLVVRTRLGAIYVPAATPKHAAGDSAAVHGG